MSSKILIVKGNNFTKYHTSTMPCQDKANLFVTNDLVMIDKYKGERKPELTPHVNACFHRSGAHNGHFWIMSNNNPIILPYVSMTGPPRQPCIKEMSPSNTIIVKQNASK
jgi:hypothetical protein